MKHPIKHRLNGSVLFEAEIECTADTSDGIKLGMAVRAAAKAGADLANANLADANLADANLADAYLAGANLAGANLAGAYLARADLAGAYLARADLADADLAGAHLAGANLADANLARADLAGAKGINPWRASPLMMLLDQPGKIRAYKVVTAGGVGPFNGGITYKVGESYEVEANTDPTEQCGRGLHVASFDWCAREWREGYRVLVLEFEAKDIACIPLGTDGKFRLHRATVVGEVDLAKRGLVTEKETAAA
jgi:hypothetical protein